MKRIIRTGNLSLAQVARRICEIQGHVSNQKAKTCKPHHQPISKGELPRRSSSDKLPTLERDSNDEDGRIELPRLGCNPNGNVGHLPAIANADRHPDKLSTTRHQQFECFQKTLDRAH